MKEKIYTTKKNGMPMLLLLILGLILSVASFIAGAVLVENDAFVSLGAVLIIFALVLMIVCMIALSGLKVLKPQEALVLTLFGEYKGTIRESGFYFVNPFCSAVNPAAMTKLSQSGDITL